jgi:Tfp pilus assembly protein PilF
MRRVGALAALLLLSSLAVFWPTLRAGFITDDFPIVQLNPVVHRGDPVEIFRTGWWEAVGGVGASLYRPVTVLSWLPERGRDGRVVPWRAHLDNVLLHALTGGCLAWWLRRLQLPFLPAAGAALLFALHPAHVSAVGGLVGRAEILATLFSLGALAVAADPGRSPARTRRVSWGTGALTFLALGSKESAAALPVLLLVQELTLLPAAGRRLLSRLTFLAPVLLAAVTYAALRVLALGAAAGPPAPLADNPIAGLQGTSRVATALALVPRYAGLLLWPENLSVDHSGNVIPAHASLLGLLPLLGALLLGGLLALVLAGLLGRVRPAVGVAAAATLLPYLVVGNLVRLVGVAYAERLAYLPSAGALALAAAGVDALLARRPGLRRPVLAAAAVLAVTAGVAGAMAATHWRSHEAVFEQAVRATPRSPRAQFTLAMIRLEQGRLDEADAGFARTVALWPTFAQAWYGRGVVAASQRRYAEAAAAFAEASRLAPEDLRAASDLGVALHRAGRPDEAERQLRRVLRRFGPEPNACGELGELLAAKGRHAEARVLLSQAVALGRRDLAGALAAVGGPLP